MSHEAISHAQFGEQLRLFMTPDELIDQTNKLDSRFFNARDKVSPRDQWEAPDSSKYGFNKGVTLRTEKQTDLRRAAEGFDPTYAAFHTKPFATMPPVELQYRTGEEHPTMMQGHHRLAHAEMQGISHIAVSYRPDVHWSWG